MDLEIQTRHAELDPAWRELIDQAVARIAERYPETLRLHVTLQHTPHHRTGLETAALLANVEGAVLRAEKQGETVKEALHAAFRAIEVELARHHEQRRHVTKGGHERLEGSIKRIFRDGGYGFIHHLPGRDVYFDRSALHGLDFETLEPGLPVEYEVEQGERGLQSPSVYPAGSSGRS